MISFKDVPKDDLAAHKVYPKFNKVYENRTLLELQKVHCSLIKENADQWQIPDYSFNQSITLIRKPPHTTNGLHQMGYFWCNPIEGDRFHADVAILKGNVVWSQCYDYNLKESTVDFIDKDISGNLDLKLNALVSMYLTKFTGVIEIEIIGEVIVSIHLRPNPRTIHLHIDKTHSKISKLYNKSTW